MHGGDSSAQLDKNDLISLVFFSHFRHGGGEHCRVFSQRGSRHCPQRGNPREHVRVSPLISLILVSQAFVMMVRSRSVLVAVLISRWLFLSIRFAIIHLECVVCHSAVSFILSCSLQLIEEESADLNIRLPLRWNQVSQMVALLPCLTLPLLLQPGLREGRFCHIAPVQQPAVHNHGCKTE